MEESPFPAIRESYIRSALGLAPPTMAVLRSSDDYSLTLKYNETVSVAGSAARWDVTGFSQ